MSELQELKGQLGEISRTVNRTAIDLAEVKASLSTRVKQQEELTKVLFAKARTQEDGLQGVKEKMAVHVGGAVRRTAVLTALLTALLVTAGNWSLLLVLNRLGG